MANVKVKFLGPSDNLIIPGDRTVYKKGDELTADRDVVMSLVKHHQHKFEAVDDDVELPVVGMTTLVRDDEARLQEKADLAAEKHEAAQTEADSGSSRNRSRRSGRSTQTDGEGGSGDSGDTPSS